MSLQIFLSLGLATVMLAGVGCNNSLSGTPPADEVSAQGDYLPLIDLKIQPLSYSVLFNEILKPRCTKCHNASDPSDASLILFEPYSAVLNGRKWKAPAATSKVVIAIGLVGKDRMPPPSEGGPLSADEIDYIKRYIDAGKPQ